MYIVLPKKHMQHQIRCIVIQEFEFRNGANVMTESCRSLNFHVLSKPYSIVAFLRQSQLNFMHALYRFFT